LTTKTLSKKGKNDKLGAQGIAQVVECLEVQGPEFKPSIAPNSQEMIN
jgi:hypothetical protein